MVDDQNEDIPNLLQIAEPTAELYEGLIAYTPAQNYSAYTGKYFGSNFLTVIERMVSVIFTTKWCQKHDVYASLHRILVMTRKPTTNF